MGSSSVPASGGGLAVTRFPIQSNAPFNIPAGLTLQATVTSTQTFSAGALPAQVWAVVVGGGGSGSADGGSPNNGGGGGGGVKIGWVDVPAAGITATIGAGGAAVTNANGNKGGATVFGNVIVHGGGGGAKAGNSLFDVSNAMPLGEGVPGYGGHASTGLYVPTAQFGVFSNGAPFAWNYGTFSISATANLNINNAFANRGAWNNYYGGGAGGIGQGTGLSPGGSGFVGGGGGGVTSGGNSSRDGGLTNTFTGGANSASASGGGAGFLANGAAGAGSNGGAGGSGGGGGGSSGTAGTGGAGGNGCVLIYY